MTDIRMSQMTGIPYGDNAGRPSGVTGQPYFNGEERRLELYTSSGWQNIVSETPGVVSVTGSYLESSATNTLEITGTNFTTGAIASVVGTDGVEINANSTTVNSIVSITAVFSGLSAVNEPYDLKVTNTSNLFGLLPDAVYVNQSPVWQTASGSLGTFNEQVLITLSALSATDSESTPISYSLASGSVLPSGVTLNSQNGVISGTLPDITTDTTYTFTINASDGENVIPRTFSISSTYTIPVEYLVVAGGGSGGRDQGGGGGAGGLRFGTTNLLRSTQSLITIGAGGTGVSSGNRGSNGTDSVALGITATGGGGGGGIGNLVNNIGSSGGSGGGGGAQWAFATFGTGGTGNTPSVSPSQGNNGGRGSSGSDSSGGGGGGGAGAAGSQGQDATYGNGGDGGIGIQSSITGTATYYAGGGGGGVYGYGQTSMVSGNGGLGGGGKGLGPGSTAPTNYDLYNGTINTGGGGGGGLGNGGVNGGSGGSGVVVIAYPDTLPAITTIPGTLTYDQPTRAGYRVYRFTSGTGTITF